MIQQLAQAFSHAGKTSTFTSGLATDKPVKAGQAIPYKGFRFYIEDNGVSSKRTMGVLNYLVRVNIQAAGAPNTPVQI